jgi:excisionase family DNA binding protein
MTPIENSANPDVKLRAKRTIKSATVTPRNLLTKQEAGDEMGGLSIGFINDLIARKKLPVVKLGYRTVRISRAAVLDYIAKHTVAGKQ